MMKSGPSHVISLLFSNLSPVSNVLQFSVKEGDVTDIQVTSCKLIGEILIKVLKVKFV